MTVTYHDAFEQGSEAWFEARRGLITASDVYKIMTPTRKTARNDKSRAHVFEIAAQRITGYIEPSYISDDMLRGHEDEITSRNLYSANYAPVTQVGFITNDEWGFTIGYSPDGVVGDDGLIECKSRRQRFQVETIVSGEMPDEYMLQCQTGLLVTGRKWLDFISYSGGLPMVTIRVLPDPEIHAAIVEAAAAFESQVAEHIAAFESNVVALRTIPTERRTEMEML